jgi:hypothetical protein
MSEENTKKRGGIRRSKLYYQTFATRCSCCNRILDRFDNSKPLPDGSFDDLCRFCKQESKPSPDFKFKDHVHASSRDGDVTSVYSGSD